MDKMTKNAIRVCEILLLPEKDSEIKSLVLENATFECNSPMYYNIKSIKEAYEFSKLWIKSIPNLKSNILKVFTQDNDVCVFMRYKGHFTGCKILNYEPNGREIDDYSFLLLNMLGDKVANIICSWDQLNIENQLKPNN